jgi:hypothetical protein
MYLPSARAGDPALASREQQSLTVLTTLYLEIFHCWMEYYQRMIIRFLVQEEVNAGTDDIHRRLHAQFTNDSYSIRSILSVPVHDSGSH